jgi:hypothetical protein
MEIPAHLPRAMPPPLPEFSEGDAVRHYIGLARENLPAACNSQADIAIALAEILSRAGRHS